MIILALFIVICGGDIVDQLIDVMCITIATEELNNIQQSMVQTPVEQMENPSCLDREEMTPSCTSTYNIRSKFLWLFDLY